MLAIGAEKGSTLIVLHQLCQRFQADWYALLVDVRVEAKSMLAAISEIPSVCRFCLIAERRQDEVWGTSDELCWETTGLSACPFECESVLGCLLKVAGELATKVVFSTLVL